jgi:predicted DNA-binding transcriptional regulator AlpA
LKDLGEIMAKNTEKALAALLNTSSVKDAAATSGLSEETLYRYLRDEDFRREYQQARRQVVESSISAMQQASSEAVETLRRNLNCENAAVETRTAQIIFENSIRGLELTDILSRLEVLEQNAVEK